MSLRTVTAETNREELDKATRLLERTLRYARERDYTGWDYADGLSSVVARKSPLETKWSNVAIQETIKRFPINIRPYLLVEQRRNYKGATLFTMANSIADRLTSRDAFDHDQDGTDYAREARRLAEWIVENRCRGYEGYCGGHPHPIQNLDRRIPAGEPDVVSTSYGVKALLEASRFDPTYGELARTAPEFFSEDLDLEETDDGAVIKYRPGASGDHYTINAVALAARAYIDLYDAFGTERFHDRARRLLDYVVERQTEVGGWAYRDPPTASHVSMDNYHNGFIIESLDRYHGITGDRRYDAELAQALEFYREVLHEQDGAPNWDETSAYPRSTHAAAQGIIVFATVGDREFASRILDWTLEHLYAGDGQFFYRKRRHYTKRFTLMRYCQAWMAYALSVYALALSGPE